MRYGPNDFNYSFVSAKEEEEGGEHSLNKTVVEHADKGIEINQNHVEEERANDNGGEENKTGDNCDNDDPFRRSSRAADESTKPYVYRMMPSSKKGGTFSNLFSSEGGSGDYSSSNYNNKNDIVMGGDGDGVDSESMTTFIVSFGACCCCISVVLVVAGGIMVAYEKYGPVSKNEKLALAGAIVLVLAVAAFLLGCCSCCFGCLAACMSPSGGSNGDGDNEGGLLGSLLGGASMDSYGDDDPHHRDVKVQFKRLSDQYDNAEEALKKVHLDVLGGSSSDGACSMKAIRDAQRKEDKARSDMMTKKSKEFEQRVQKDLEAGYTTQNIRRNYRPIAFLIRFDGDTMLSMSMELLRKQVSIIVNCGRAGVDQAIVVLTSPGGEVSAYGLAASQLVRIRKAGIQLIICVDTVAASGGYMMASVGNVIYAAPFAIIGSIGVVTQIPNFQRFLNKHDIDAYLFTAGKHKRTIDMIGDVTEENKQKLQDELNDLHRAFKDHVALSRPKLEQTIDDVASGEYWVAVQAKELGLVDDIMTSDEYVESICPKYDVIEIVEKRRPKPFFRSTFRDGVVSVLKNAMESIISSSSSSLKRPMSDYRAAPPMAVA